MNSIRNDYGTTHTCYMGMEKDDPQPHEEELLGLSTTSKDARIISSVKSIVAPLMNESDSSSTTT
eukprot:scaffold624_cov402-Prasinococcus_capsulatus_cf.AAC.15